MDSSKNHNWNCATNAVYKSVLLFAIAGAASSLFSIIPLMGWVSSICDICVIAGFTVFIIKLKDLSLLADEQDAGSIKKLVVGVNLYFIGMMLAFIPAVGGILKGIDLIVAFVFMLLAYSALKKSETFAGKDGAKLLFTAMILGAVGALLRIIPLIGIVGSILLIIEFVLTILGWKKIAAPVA